MKKKKNIKTILVLEKFEGKCERKKIKRKSERKDYFYMFLQI